MCLCVYKKKLCLFDYSIIVHFGEDAVHCWHGEDDLAKGIHYRKESR